MPAYSRLRRGFTLLELMTAVVILIILASLAVTLMTYGMGRARVNNAVFDAAALYSTAQLRAMSRNSPHYILVRQDVDGRLRLHMLERPDATPILDWNMLDLTGGPEAALAFDEPQDVGPPIRRNAFVRDQLVLGASTGLDSGGLAFLDLDSPDIRKPLLAPFSSVPVTTPLVNSGDLRLPTQDLLAGCSFCVRPAAEPYGVIRFNPNGTVRMMTGASPTGGVIAFISNAAAAENSFLPKLLTISAPSGAINVF